LSKCSKWRLSKKGGLVADGWFVRFDLFQRLAGMKNVDKNID